MRRMMYAVFLPDQRWERTGNKRLACRFAKLHKGYVSAMPDGPGAWDAPTCRVCSDTIADYREQQA